jgi:hypothetical protein
MPNGSLYHGDIISAFQRHVPDCYVRDYRGSGGFITVCRNYRTIKWGGQTTTTPVEKSVPAITLLNLPRGNVTAKTLYMGLKLHRPGWRQEFRRARRHLTTGQIKAIERTLRMPGAFSESG